MRTLADYPELAEVDKLKSEIARIQLEHVIDVQGYGQLVIVLEARLDAAKKYIAELEQRILKRDSIILG